MEEKPPNGNSNIAGQIGKMGLLFPISYRVHYWPFKKENGSWWKFCYSPNKFRESGGGKGFFIAYACRYDKKSGKWISTKAVKRRIRWKAKDAAFKMFCQKSGKEFRSLHRTPYRDNEQIEKLRQQINEEREKMIQNKSVHCPACRASIVLRKKGLILCGQCGEEFAI